MPGGRYGLECKIYVGDLARDASEQELEKAFSYYGALKNVWVARNPPGFAFIEFDDARDAEDAVRGMDGTTLCGSRIRCEQSTGKSGPKPWSGSSGGGRGRDGGGRGPPRLRKPYDPNDRCYECGGRGHYAYDCTRGAGGRRHSRSRSGSRDRGSNRGYGRRYRSPSPSRGRYNRSRSRSRSRGRYYRSRSRSRSRGRYRTRSRSGSRSPERSAARYRSRSPMRSSERNNRYSRSRSRERKSDQGSPARNGGD